MHLNPWYGFGVLHLIHLFLAIYHATYVMHASVNIAIIAIQPITHHVYNEYIHQNLILSGSHNSIRLS